MGKCSIFIGEVLLPSEEVMFAVSCDLLECIKSRPQCWKTGCGGKLYSEDAWLAIVEQMCDMYVMDGYQFDIPGLKSRWSQMKATRSMAKLRAARAGLEGEAVKYPYAEQMAFMDEGQEGMQYAVAPPTKVEGEYDFNQIFEFDPTERATSSKGKRKSTSMNGEETPVRRRKSKSTVKMEKMGVQEETSTSNGATIASQTRALSHLSYLTTRNQIENIISAARLADAQKAAEVAQVVTSNGQTIES